MDRRAFLTAAGALALAPAARAAQKSAKSAKSPPLDAKAARTAPGTVRLDWTGAAPVSIFVSADPDAGTRAMRPLKIGAAGGAADLAAPVSPRPYFLVTAADGRQTRVAERLLPLEGGRNFRDLGGYRAVDGRQVRWGRIFRSGVMSGLTAADMAYLGKLGVAVICDLRSPQERTAEPSPFLKGGPKVVATDYDMSASMAAFAKLSSREEAVQAFADAYVGFLDLLTPHYTDMFARLAAGEAPLAMNCSAGKDRTGMGSALVLSVLGVPRETVVADYALTQVYTPPSYYMTQMAGGQAGAGVSSEQAQMFAKLPPEVLAVIMGSDPQVMRRALAAIDARHGGPLALAKARFGLTDGKIATLRAAYLT